MKKGKQGRHQVVLFLLVAAAAACALAQAGCASKPRTFKVGILNGHDFLSGISEGFKTKMAELGYNENETVVYNYQTSGFAVDMDLYRKLCRTLADDKVDVVLTYPTEASLIAKEVLAGKIPFIFTNASTEDTGLIDSIQSPGTNITGVRYPTPEIALRRFEFLLQIKPGMKRVLVPYLKGYPTVPSQTKVLEPSAKEAGVELVELALSAPTELPNALAGLDKAKGRGVDGILFLSDPASVTPAFTEPIYKFGGRQKIPIACVESAYGGVEFTIGVMIDLVETGKEAAVAADKILKGAPAGSIPVATTANYLTVNYKEAQRLGLSVPEGMLKQAIKVIR